MSVPPLIQDTACPGVDHEDHHTVVTGPPGDEVDRAAIHRVAETGVELFPGRTRSDGGQDLRERHETTLSDGVAGLVLFGAGGGRLSLRRGRTEEKESKSQDRREGSPGHSHTLPLAA